MKDLLKSINKLLRFYTKTHKEPIEWDEAYKQGHIAALKWTKEQILHKLNKRSKLK